MESMRLDAEACELLPLAAGPGGPQSLPALPATEATVQRVLLAVLKMARIRFICGDLPPPATNIRRHLLPYLERRWGWGGWAGGVGGRQGGT